MALFSRNFSCIRRFFSYTVEFTRILGNYENDYRAIDNSMKNIKLGLKDSSNKDTLECFFKFANFLSSKKTRNKALFFAFQEDFTGKMSTLNSQELENLVTNLLSIENHWAFYSTEFMQKLTEEVYSSISNENQNQKILDTYLEILKKISTHDINSFKKLKDFLSKFTLETIKTLDWARTAMLIESLKLITNSSNIHALKAKDSNSIFFNIEHGISPSYIKTDNIKVLSNLWVMLIINDKSEEQFYRRLENLIFNNLEKLDLTQLCYLSVNIKKRILHDKTYILENITSKIYNRIDLIFDSLSLNDLTQVLGAYLTSSKIYGLYTNGSLETKLIERLSNLKTCSENVNLKSQSTFLNFLSETRRITLDTCKSLYEANKSLNTFFANKDVVFIAYYFSKIGEVGDFWDKFVEHKNLTLNHTFHYSFYYSLYLNLSLQHPELYQKLKTTFEENLELYREAWKKNRKTELDNYPSSFLHKETIKVLRSNNIKFEIEAEVEYLVDIAIPDLKTVVEINGPGHFLFPKRALNGQSFNKKTNITKLGWNYVNLPYWVQKKQTYHLDAYLMNCIKLIKEGRFQESKQFFSY